MSAQDVADAITRSDYASIRAIMKLAERHEVSPAELRNELLTRGWRFDGDDMAAPYMRRAADLRIGDQLGARSFVVEMHSSLAVFTSRDGATRRHLVSISLGDKPDGQPRWITGRRGSMAGLKSMRSDEWVRLFVPKAKAAKVSHAPVEVGTIFVSTWGYDQTNVDYYEVTRSTTSSVWVRPLAQVQMDAPAYMQERVAPLPLTYIGPERMHRVRWSGDHVYFSPSSSASASVWDGERILATHYA